MKLLFFNLFFIAFILLTPQKGFSQTSQTDQDSIENKVRSYLSEVFLECPQYINAYQISQGIELMSRMTFHMVPMNEHPEYPLLSTVGLKNKCNYNMSNDVAQFNPNTFNPFKYIFPKQASHSLFCRVDGTEYVIEIKPTNKPLN